MTHFWHHSDQAARFVEGLAEHSKPGSALTTTIVREKSGGYSVHIVTGELSDDIAENSEAWKFYKPLLTT
jgi:hypothetical protein